MGPFGLHDVKVLVFKDLVRRKGLFGLFLGFKLINLILKELDLHLIFAAQVAEVLWVIVDD